MPSACCAGSASLRRCFHEGVCHDHGHGVWSEGLMILSFRAAVATLALVSLPAAVLAAPVPSAIYTDPPHDTKFPASTAVLHIPTHGVAINGLAYLPPGPGTHPVLLICHGLPGNEKNLDLAQAVRRAGWVAVTFNYRGSWGSPGNFS